MRRSGTAVEWPTLGVCAMCYIGILGTTAFSNTLSLTFSMILLALSLALYSSFSHEVLHGHPFKKRALNEALVFPSFGLLIPFERFRDTHLAHHHDPSLTDPYDDPETNFVDPAIWNSWCSLRRRIYHVNNTLLGRILIGPVIGLGAFYASDFGAIRNGNRSVLRAYGMHLAGLLPVFAWLVWASEMPIWAYLVSVYVSHSLLKIRTFLEHRAHETARCRSVIIEDRGPFAFLFLNNNLHAVHHARPGLPWYKLTGFYRAHRAHFLRRNGGYYYRSYREIFQHYLLRTKDPVPHSLWTVTPDMETARSR